jgi:hypothetical protein
VECGAVSGFGPGIPFGAGFTNPNSPNLTDFMNWVYAAMQIPVDALPLDSLWPTYAFNQAMALVPCVPCVPAITYVLATYNCGGHLLIKIAIDQPDQTFFKCARDNMKFNDPEIGIVQSSSDNGSSNSFAIGSGMQNMTLSDLNFYRSPWGREYLSYIQDLGPSIWGLS